MDGWMDEWMDCTLEEAERSKNKTCNAWAGHVASSPRSLARARRCSDRSSNTNRLYLRNFHLALESAHKAHGGRVTNPAAWRDAWPLFLAFCRACRPAILTLPHSRSQPQGLADDRTNLQTNNKKRSSRSSRTFGPRRRAGCWLLIDRSRHRPSTSDGRLAGRCSGVPGSGSGGEC